MHATYPADFISANLCIQTNLIKVPSMLNSKALWGQADIPKNCPQPMREESLLTGPLKLQMPHMQAKISGIKLIEALNIQYSASHEIDYRSRCPQTCMAQRITFIQLTPTYSRFNSAISRWKDCKLGKFGSLGYRSR